MNVEGRIVQAESEPSTPGADDLGGRGARIWVNWGLALSTAPAAAVVMALAVGGVMSTASCREQCPNLGPNGIVWAILFYGAPIVAVVTIVGTFFTASRRRGIVVPLCGWALLLADVAVFAVLFR
ncbi:MAG: hypothetical protein ABI253_04625 [Mycobacterium sp.]